MNNFDKYFILLFYNTIILIPGCYTIFYQSTSNPNKPITVNVPRQYPPTDSIEYSKEHINPDISFTSFQFNERTFPIKTEPASYNPDVVIEFDKFISKMRFNFSKSKLTKGEAEKIYSILEKRHYREESFGMPGPGNPKLIFDVRKRISVRKLSDSIFEIFYSLSGCGLRFNHNRIEIFNDKIINEESIESWRIHNPC